MEKLKPGTWVSDCLFGDYSEKYGPEILYYDDDCATQCILNILWDLEDYNRKYFQVEIALRDDKRIEERPGHLEGIEKQRWMGNHIGPHANSIARVLTKMTPMTWEVIWLNRKRNLKEFAIEHSKVPYMGVLTTDDSPSSYYSHISAVNSGVIFDPTNAVDWPVIGVILPTEYVGKYIQINRLSKEDKG